MTISISAALKRHLAQPYQTTCTLWKVTLSASAGAAAGTVKGFTDLDRDVVKGGVTYLAEVGYTRTDIATSGALNVDNLEVDGVLNSPSINETDLMAGIWDFAAIQISLVNWADYFVFNPITSITRSGTVATAIVASTAQLASGDTLVISGAVQSQYNGTFTITVTGPTHFTFPVSGSPATPATGTIVYQTNMGEMILRVGTLGEVTQERGVFKAELRGLAQAYTRVIGQLTGPSCRTTLGSSLCKIDMTPFTVTGTLTGVSADNRTVFDTSRTEPGPGGTSSPITGITQANPGHVTVSVALDTSLTEGSAITISGVVGMDAVNNVTVIHNIASDRLSFDLPTDTSSLPAWISGGTVTPLGSGSGYFDNGVFTWTSGPNTGFSIEVQSYVPGQITFQLPVGPPNALPAAPQIGDTYTLKAGCDYSPDTCKNRFNNLVNFRGEPFVPGIDKLTQVGKSV